MSTTTLVAGLLLAAMCALPLGIRYLWLKKPLEPTFAAPLSLLVAAVAIGLDRIGRGLSADSWNFERGIVVGLFCAVILMAPFRSRAEKERIARDRLNQQKNSSGLRAP